MLNICVYGDFKNKDIKVRVVTNREQFTFQNVLISAGYDAELFTVSDDATIEKDENNPN